MRSLTLAPSRVAVVRARRAQAVGRVTDALPPLSYIVGMDMHQEPGIRHLTYDQLIDAFGRRTAHYVDRIGQLEVNSRCQYGLRAFDRRAESFLRRSTPHTATRYARTGCVSAGTPAAYTARSAGIAAP